MKVLRNIKDKILTIFESKLIFAIEGFGCIGLGIYLKDSYPMAAGFLFGFSFVLFIAGGD